MIRIFLSVLTLSIFFVGQVKALDCFFNCHSNTQIEESARDHCDSKKSKTKSTRNNNCDFNICSLSVHEKCFFTLVSFKKVEYIKNIQISNKLFEKEKLLKSTLIFSPYYSYIDNVPILSATPLFIRIKHLLI